MNATPATQEQFMLNVSRDVFALATAQVNTNADPKLNVRALVMAQPEHLRLSYAAELCRCLVMNLGDLLLDLHGTQEGARAAIGRGALNFESAVNDTTTPPSDDGKD
ncbi:hypothetical protein [Arthrobacter wenxiniae]|uniref:Uncharacterized protein n=1 Tax=Arthrobacter wenxiniae TaxID=2713570 RepID=A0A7Y7IFW7_9MICC|nr:hypothetical protein [Arthrobacter wenxiniae]NVM94761.1 hypothetical protein [Arthrobacter wenxiniae]